MDSYTSSQRESIERACKDDLRAVLQEFHEALTEADKSDIFAAPVTDEVAPQYSEIIPHPMDFGTIQDKLYKYRSFRDYFAHVELVFSNAITYNGWDNFIGGMVEDLQKYCVKFLPDAANVNLQGNKISTKKPARTPGRPKSKSSPAAAGKQRARRKPVAASSEDEEDSWHSSSSGSDEDDDDEDEEEEEEDFSDDSDYGAGKKRRLRRHDAPKSKKKAKRRYY
eukprot:jgi/Phyca11/503058/fgenesh2_kg.PHYCAscaffold_2_\